MDVYGLNYIVDNINERLTEFVGYGFQLNRAILFNRYKIGIEELINDSFSRILFYLTDNNNPEYDIGCCSVVFETDKTEENKNYRYYHIIIVSANGPREANIEQLLFV